MTKKNNKKVPVVLPLSHTSAVISITATYGKADANFPNAISHWLHGSMESGLLHAKLQMGAPDNYLRVEAQQCFDILRSLYVEAPRRHVWGRLPKTKVCRSPITDRRHNIAVVIQNYERLALTAIHGSTKTEESLNMIQEIRRALTRAAKMKHMAEFSNYAAILDHGNGTAAPFVTTTLDDTAVATAAKLVATIDKERSLRRQNPDTDTPTLTVLTNFQAYMPITFDSTDDMVNTLRMYSERNPSVRTKAKELVDTSLMSELWENLLYTYRRLLCIGVQDVVMDNPYVTDNLRLHVAGVRVLQAVADKYFVDVHWSIKEDFGYAALTAAGMEIRKEGKQLRKQQQTSADKEFI